MSRVSLAVRRGRLHDVKRLLTRRNVNYTVSDGQTLLDLADERGRRDIVKLILTFRPTDRRALNETLHTAAYGGHIDLIKLLLQCGAEVNSRDEDSMTPLHTAAVAGHKIAIRTLLKFGADVHAKDNSGYTAIHYAAVKNAEAVSILVNAGGDVNGLNGSQMTPLYVASLRGNSSMVTALLEMGAKHDITAMHDTALRAASTLGHADVVKELLKFGASAEETDSAGRRALHCACLGRSHSVVDILLNNGAEVDPQDNFGVTPLHIASNLGPSRTVRRILKSGASVDLALSALDSTIRGSKILSIIGLLLDYGANVDQPDELGYTPVMVAYSSGNSNVISALLEHGAYFNPRSPQCCRTLACAKTPRSLKVPDVFEMHFIKLQTAGLRSPQDIYLKHPTMPLKLGPITRKRFQKRCEKEVAHMKRQKISYSTATYFELLTESVAVSRNTDIVDHLQSQGLEGLVASFPTYGNLLHLHFKIGLQRRNLLDKCYPVFSLFTPLHIPIVIIDEIYGYLSNQDLSTLSEFNVFV